MKGTALLLVAFFAWLLPSLWAFAASGGETPEDRLFESANEAYSRGEYQGAIDRYQQIIKTAGYSPPVLYNLANSYAQTGQTGRAVLNYERGLRLSPTNSDILGNLELLRKERGLFPKEPGGAERFFGLLTVDQWATLVMISLLLLSLFLLASLRYRFTRQLTIGVTATSSLLFCLAVSGILFRYPFYNPSVVIASEVKLSVSPFALSATSGSLQEGRLVYPKKQHGDFSYVVDETERKGWVPSRVLEAVCTAAYQANKTAYER